MSESPDTQSEREPPEGISLSELTEAFAEVMGVEPAARTDTPVDREAGQPPLDTPAAEPAEPLAEPTEDDDPCEIGPQTILEAMLFVGNRDNEPLSVERAAELMRDVEPDEIRERVGELNRRYSSNGCPYHVVREGSGYRLSLRKSFHPLRNRFYGRVREARLSQAAVDVLAIVAYQQPLTGEEVNRLRGKPSSHVLSQLVRRGLLRIERKDPKKRRIVSYFTTDRFLALFGLESIEDLPQSEELDRQ